MDPSCAQEQKGPPGPADPAGGTSPVNDNPHPTSGEEGAVFDAYAARYDAELNKGLRLSGEPKEYFAKERMLRLRERLEEYGCRPSAALDFGCGTGTSTPYFFDILGVRSLRGMDPSDSSLEEGRRRWRGLEVTFAKDPSGWAHSCDLAFCNGVFHHIPLASRSEAFVQVREILQPGGLFAFWENNPWNPLTRLAMRLVPFDRDAIPVFPHEARRALRDHGFEILRTDYAFFFPKALSRLRFLEPWLRWLPLGGQYLVLCRNPLSANHRSS
jgi:SAM-dependent methyltransferase